MAEIATIARPYAEALFKACADQGEGASRAALDWVDRIGSVAASPALLQLVGNPKITSEQLFDVMSGVVGEVLPALAQNFLRTVIDNGRVEALPEIATQFRALVNRLRGSSDAVVYSAFAMDASALSDLGSTLEKRFARKLNLSVQRDESLIGGIRVVVGDEVLDTSVKARLEQMKAALTA